MIKPFRGGVYLLPSLILGLILSTGCSTYRRATATIIKVLPGSPGAVSPEVQTENNLRMIKALERTELAAGKAEAAADKAQQASQKANVAAQLTEKAAEKAESAASKAEAVFLKK